MADAAVRRRVEVPVPARGGDPAAHEAIAALAALATPRGRSREETRVESDPAGDGVEVMTSATG